MLVFLCLRFGKAEHEIPEPARESIWGGCSTPYLTERTNPLFFRAVLVGAGFSRDRRLSFTLKADVPPAGCSEKPLGSVAGWLRVSSVKKRMLFRSLAVQVYL